MKRSHYSEVQINGILKEVEVGPKVAECSLLVLHESVDGVHLA